MDQSGCLCNSAIQIDRCKKSLRGVCQNRGALSAAAGFFTAAQLQILSQLQLSRDLIQTLLTHQCCTDAGQITLRQIRMLRKQEFCRHKPQHGIPQKLQPLVAVQVVGAMLIGIGTVAQRLTEQSGISEGIIQFFL